MPRRPERVERPADIPFPAVRAGPRRESDAFPRKALLPHDQAVRTGRWSVASAPVYFRLELAAISPNHALQIRLFRPDASDAVDDQRQIPFGVSHGRGPLAISRPRVNFSTVGCWRLEIWQAKIVAKAPIRVVATKGQIRNRPPNRIADLSLVREQPATNDVIQCLLTTSLVTGDPGLRHRALSLPLDGRRTSRPHGHQCGALGCAAAGNRAARQPRCLLGNAVRRTVVRADRSGRGHHTVVTRVASLALVLLAAAALAVFASAREAKLPGLMTSKAPWSANNRALLYARLDKIGIPALKAEGQRLHTHQHLDIVIRGRGYPIPAGIGIDFGERFISPLHTHDFSGITHVESPTIRKFTLGQFFDVWGLRFSANCLGGYCAKGNERVWVFVNGKRWLGNPRQIALRAHQESSSHTGHWPPSRSRFPSFFPFPPGL